MADRRYADSQRDVGQDNNPEPEADRPPGLPRWLTVSGIVVIVLVLVAVIAIITGVAGPHGPEQFGPGQH
jgi:hypothetical protein